MTLKRCTQLVTASSVALALVLGTSAPHAWADEETQDIVIEDVVIDDHGAVADEEGAPRKKVRIRLGRAAKKHAAKPRMKQAKSASPMDSVERWLMGQIGGGLSSAATSPGALLQGWFDGGDDVPMAGLRDTLKADGWDAKKLEAWLGEQLMTLGPQLMQRFAAGHGKRGPGMRGPGMGGPGMGGPGMRGPGMGGPGMRGPGMGGPGMRGPQGMPHGQQGGFDCACQKRCPQCGAHGSMSGAERHGRRGGPNSQVPHARGFQGRWFGGRMGRGPMGHGQMGPGRMGPGPMHDAHGFHGRSFHGQGPRGQAGHGQSFPGQSFPGQGHPGLGMQHGQMGPAHSQSRTVIMWHDGTRWHRQEMSGAAMGGHAAPGHLAPVHPTPGHGHGHGHGHGGIHPQPGPQKKKALRWKKSFTPKQPGASAPHGFGSISVDGHTIDPDVMKKLMELLGRMGSDHAGASGEGADVTKMLIEALQSQFGKAKATTEHKPKVRVKIKRSKKGEEELREEEEAPDAGK